MALLPGVHFFWVPFSVTRYAHGAETATALLLLFATLCDLLQLLSTCLHGRMAFAFALANESGDMFPGVTFPRLQAMRALGQAG